MLKNISLLIIGVSAFLLTGCKTGVKPENLRGKWKYVKVFKPDASPPDSTTYTELEEAKPYIEFSGDNKLQIVWGGEVISHGTYTIEGDNIQFTEVFANGQSRKFPFFVSELTDKKIVFETLGSDGKRVVGVRFLIPGR